jgi:hypothetical protein
MFDQLTALGYGIVVFAIIIGVGSIVLTNFGSATAGCSTSFPWNATLEKCQNSTGSVLGESTSLTNAKYLTTQLGTSGLAGWTPAVVAISIGLLFLGAFMVGKGGKGRY